MTLRKLNSCQRFAPNDMDYMPWLLDQMHKNEIATGKRLLDIFSLHYYPQGGEFGNDTSEILGIFGREGLDYATGWRWRAYAGADIVVVVELTGAMCVKRTR